MVIHHFPRAGMMARGLKKQLQEQADQHTAQIQDPQNARVNRMVRKNNSVEKSDSDNTWKRTIKTPLDPGKV